MKDIENKYLCAVCGKNPIKHQRYLHSEKVTYNLCDECYNTKTLGELVEINRKRQ